MADIFDDIIELLERRRHGGVLDVRLTPETRRGLFAAVPSGRQAAGRPSGASPPVARPVARPAASAGVPAPVPPPVPAVPAVVAAQATVDLAVPAADPAVAVADWQSLSGMVAGCTRCPLHRGRTRAVFGEGAHAAELMFIGEGPGAQEDATGRPFVGDAGQLLDRMILAMQLRREEVYIANIVKCRPMGNRNPLDEEALACLPYLNRQIELVRPKLLVLLGAVPLLYLLGKTGITHLHGQWFEYQGIPVMPTFHPAYLLRSPARKKEAWDDLQQVMRRLGKDPALTVAGRVAGSG